MRAADLDRVLVLAPTSADAELSRSILRDAGLACETVTSLREAAEELGRGAGAMVVSAESLLSSEEAGLLGEALRGQPAWSDLPVFLLSGSADAAAPALGILGHATLLERPVRVAVLVSALRTAIRTRRRQYELRDQIAALQAAEAEVKDLNRRLRDDLDDMSRLHGLSTRLVQTTDMGELLEEILGAAISTVGADMGLIQLLEGRSLRIVAHSGFDARFLGRFGEIEDDPEGWGAALHAGRRVVVADVAVDPLVRPGGEDREALLGAGVRSLQVTPLVSRAGRLVGLLATHRRAPHVPDENRLRLLDLLVRQAADFVERGLGERRLREQADRLRLLWTTAAVLMTREDPDAMLQAVFARIAPRLGLDAYFNFMVDESGESLRLASCSGITESEARQVSRKEISEALCGHASARGEPVVAMRIQESDDPRLAAVRGYGIRAFVCNPLVADDRLLGTLTFASRSRDELDPGEVEFLETIAHYVTIAYERLSLIRQLQDTDKRKDEFLATLAHELRNPLAPLRNALHIMALAGSDTAAVERARAVMERQLAQMVRLIDDLLDVSRITRGRLELRKERVDLATVLNNSVDTTRPLIEAAGHRLTVELPARPVPLDADPMRLAQVFSNLLNNAAKYTDRGGRIDVCVELEGQEVVVSVKDDGVGIPPEALPFVFDMFTQVNRSLEKAQGGLGIGLTLVKRLVEMHGGSVQALSEGEGRGSEFRVRLAVAPAGAPQGAELPASRGRGARVGRRILVADDNRDAAESMGVMLRMLGHEVRAVHDGQEAVEEAAVFRPDVVLLDIGMPRLNGYDAARQIRRQGWGRDMLLVALTGWGQDEDKRRAAQAGFDEHFTKPVSPSEIDRFVSSRRER